MYVQIKKLVPIMKYYYQAWPVNAFLKQYLGSAAAKYRKDMRRLLELNEIPSRHETTTAANKDAEDFIGFSSDEDGTSESESDGDGQNPKVCLQLICT